MVVLTSFTQPTDGIRHRQNNTTVYVNDNNLGKGTLFIAESRLSWVSDSGNGFSIEYPYISLHAISRDLSSFPQECLFLMLDTTLGDGETNNGNGENDIENENGSDSETTEIRLVPDDRGMLDAMFHAMNACQALHPDPEDSFSDEDFYEDADDEVPMEEADHRMAGLHIGDTEEEVEDSILHTLEGEGVPEVLAPLLIRNTSWGRVVDREGRVVDRVGMGVDMVVDRGVGILGGRGVGILGGRGVGILGGRGAGILAYREVGTLEDRGVDMEVGTLEDRGVDMEVGTLEDRGVDMEVGTEVDTGVGTEVGTEVDTGLGTLEGSEGSAPSLIRNNVVWDRVVDRVGDMGVDRVVGTAVDMGVGTGAHRVGDMGVGRVVDRGVGRVVDRGVGTLDRGVELAGERAAERVVGRACTARGGRSFSLGSNLNQGSPAPVQTVRTARQDPQEESYFDDAEN